MKLKQQKSDLGAHRFTIDATEESKHYSETTWEQWIWGSSLVYKDNLSSNEVVTLTLTEETVDF